MTKKYETIRTDIDYPLNWRDDNDIENIQYNLDELKKLGATHINFYLSMDWDIPSLEITAYQERLETEEEYENRQIREENKKKREEYEKKSRELAFYKEIKKKYNL